MPDIDPNKTVFISYRRSASRYIARSILEHLSHHEYDAFLDVKSIDSGDWATIILNQIAARAHFLIILTPGTLDRCSEPNDMLRREIERAMELGRNIVPVLVDEFNFGMAESHLTDKLAELPKYNGLRLYYDFFDASMDMLRNRFLKAPAFSPVIQPTPVKEELKVEQAIEQAAHEPLPTKEELSAEQFAVRGYGKQENGDLDGAIADYTEAIRLNPEYAEAYNNRGVVRAEKGDLDAAIADYSAAIRLNPEYAEAYFNRGIARRKKGDLDAAIGDYDSAIRLNPEYVDAYNNRGVARGQKGDLDAAIADYSAAIRLKPDDADAYNNRGVAHEKKYEFDKAIADYSEAIHLKPEYAEAYSNQAEIYFMLKQYDKALAGFRKSNELRREYPMIVGGLAITHHALGNGDEARRLWRGLVEQDARYKDVEWVRQEFNWAEPLVEAARQVIAALK